MLPGLFAGHCFTLFSENFLRFIHDRLCREAKLLEQHARRSGCAEVVDGHIAAVETDIFRPAKGRARLHGNPCADRTRKHALFICGILFLEQVHAGHGDHARGYAVFLELFRSVHAKFHLAARADQDHIRSPAAIL